MFTTEAAKHIQQLAQISREVTLPKGTRISDSKVYYLKKGICVLKHLTSDGEESAFIFFRPGMLMNFLYSVITSTGIGTELTGKRLQMLNHAIFTQTDCTLLAMDGKVFLDFLEKHPNLYKLLLQSLSDNLINLLAVSTDIVSKPASERVCQVIMDFMSNEEIPEIPGFLTYTVIANYLSMHVMTVTKIFKALRQEGIISRRGRTARVTDKEKLIAISTGSIELKY